MPVTCTEVIAKFRLPPTVIRTSALRQNYLRFRISPDVYKDACSLAQAKGLPSLIYHEPVLEVRFVRGAAGPTSFLTKRERSRSYPQGLQARWLD
jgi:hypothetical protein